MTEQEEKKRELYFRQKKLLETFLANGAITKAQFDKSFGDLTVKMGMQKEFEASENEANSAGVPAENDG